MTTRPPTERLSASRMGLRAVGIDEAREIVGSPALRAWCGQYEAVHAELVRHRRSSADPLLEIVLQVGQDEEQLAAAEAELAALDGSFDALSDFEQQSERATVATQRLQAVEYELECCRDRLVELQERKDAVDRVVATPEWTKSRAVIVDAIGELQRTMATLDGEVATLRQRFDAETWRKEALWRDVSDTWVRGFSASMRRSEFAYRVARGRAALASVGDSQPPRRDPPAATVGDTQMRKHELREQVTRQFGCLVIDEFLYWPKLDCVDRVLCVPLLRERKHFNIEVTPLQVYEIDGRRGLEFIEPVTAGDDALLDDSRLDAFFAVGRPQRPPAPMPHLGPPPAA